MPDILSRFFHARSMAIIGASTDPSKLGGRPLRMIKELGFKGAVYPVHPTASIVQDFPAYNTIDALPGEFDCALVAVPQQHVLGAIQGLSRKQVPLAIILSSGFGEHSDEGAREQERIIEIARQAEMRIVGPNSMGGISFETGICGTFTSVAEHQGRTYPRLGHVSIASQSGFVGSHLMGLLRDRGIGIAKWLATGNQSDIDISDVIEHYANDAITRIIVVYVEGIRDAGALRKALDTARLRGKQVIALKVGRTELGAKAIASHTAALVGNSDAYDAVFRRHGVLVAYSLEDLADLVCALDTGRTIPGSRLGIATVSGGFGILMSDVAATHGLDVPELAPQLQAELLDYYALASTLNPVDMGSLVRIGPAIGALLNGNFDCIAIGAGHFGLIDSQVKRLFHEMQTFREQHSDCFIGLTALLTDDWKAVFQGLGIFTCEDPSRLISAMARISQIASHPDPDTSDWPKLPQFDAAVLRAATDERAARAILRQCGIGVAEESLATTSAEAVAAARLMGGRVALKISSRDIPHKSEVGGVLLGLQGDDAVGAGFETIMRSAQAACPGALVDGVLMSPMIEGGVEILVGFTTDSVFGPLVAVAMGGVMVEVLKDKAIEVAPFGKDIARAMLSSLKGSALLQGFRGQAPVNLEAAAEAIHRLSIFAADNATVVASLEINPLIVTGDGVIAVDALLIPKSLA